jgi:L-asparaginase
LNAVDFGDTDPIGVVEDGKVPLFGPPPEPPRPLVFLSDVLATEAAAWPRVEIVSSHAGAGSRLVDLLVAERMRRSGKGIDGIVIAATGNGNVSTPI